MSECVKEDTRFFKEGERVGVLTTRPVDGLLDYFVPQGGAEEGAFVEIPLGATTAAGVVWGEGEGSVAAARTRAISRVLDTPPMRREMRRFLTQAAHYTVTPLHAMLRLATRVKGLGASAADMRAFKLSDRRPDKMTSARRRVIAVFEDCANASLPAKEIEQAASVSHSVVAGLEKAGVLLRESIPRDKPYPELDLDRHPVALTEDQSDAVRKLKSKIADGQFSSTLLKGVTGSGKTEVYLDAAADVLKRGRQVLVLLPEIALTAQFLSRVVDRFGARPGEWHSSVTASERRRLWRKAGEGQVQLVVGARSALFLPFKDLGLIVVDEEHDTSYKQQEGIQYNARDMAVLRASLCGAAVILTSATPSLETWSNARSGKYDRVDLPSRFGSAVLPEIASVDMKAESLPSGKWISGPLALEVRKRIELREQSLLFLNRRGFAPITLCRECGQQINCVQCDARMVEHRFTSRLVCHQCGASRPFPETCDECGARDKFVPIGPGIERLAEEVSEIFAGARIELLSSDFSGAPNELRRKLESIARGDADIIIGTQLVAKGHNFPLITLVGVIDADIGLHGSDLRAAERTFQIIRQVTGRAGRAEKKGVAMIQTWQPDHKIFEAIISDDDEGFWEAEAAERRVAGAPPFGRYAGIILSGADPVAVRAVAGEMARTAAPLRNSGAQLFGPAPAPIALIRGRTRYRFLIKAEKSVPLQQAIIEWMRQFKVPSNVRLTVDIDPQRFL